MRATKPSGDAIKERFGRNLSRRMADLNLNSSRLADELGVSRADISRYSRGLVMPAWDRYAALCDRLNVAPTYFLKDSK